MGGTRSLSPSSSIGWPNVELIQTCGRKEVRNLLLGVVHWQASTASNPIWLHPLSLSSLGSPTVVPYLRPLLQLVEGTLRLSFAG